MLWSRRSDMKGKIMYWRQTLTIVLRDLDLVLRDLDFVLRDLDFVL